MGKPRYDRNASDDIADWYLEAARGRINGVSVVHKFGLAEDVDTGDGQVDVWDGVSNDIGGKVNPYNWAPGAVIGQISSTNAGDNQAMSVQGLDANGDLTVFEVTLNGQTPVEFPILLKRCFRVFNADSTEHAGFVYVSGLGDATTGGKPTSDLDIYAIVHPENQQTQMALYTVPSGYNMYIKHGWANLSKPSTTEAVVQIFRRDEGGVFRVLHTLSLQTSGSSGDHRPYEIPLPIPGGTDLVYRAQVFSNNSAVSAGFHGVLIKD